MLHVDEQEHAVVCGNQDVTQVIAPGVRACFTQGMRRVTSEPALLDVSGR
jgi:hypothetical protein